MTTTSAVRPGSPELASLLNRIAEGAEKRERELIPPREAIGWIKEAGLGRLRVPVAEGGGGATVREFFEILIALAEADANVAHILRTHYWFVEQQLQSADPALRARGIALLNANALVGNAFSEQSRRTVGLQFDTAFTPDGDGYRLNGVKFYSTGSMYSDYTQIWGAAPGDRIAGAVIPVRREGLTIGQTRAQPEQKRTKGKNHAVTKTDAAAPGGAEGAARGPDRRRVRLRDEDGGQAGGVAQDTSIRPGQINGLSATENATKGCMDMTVLKPEQFRERFTVYLNGEGHPVRRGLREMTAGEVLAAIQWQADEANRLERECAPFAELQSWPRQARKRPLT